MIDDYLVNLVLEILQSTSLVTLAPLRLFLVIGAVDVTNDYFQVPNITVNNWTLNTTTITLSNATDIIFGISTSNYFGSAILQIKDQLNRVIVNKLFNVAIEQGAEYRIPTGFLTISLSNVSNNLGNFLLDRLRELNINNFIKSPTYSLLTNDPNSWELLISTFLVKTLDKRFFSKIKQNIIGQLEISYGESFSVTNSNFYDVFELSVRKKVATYNASLDYSNRTWFSLLGVSNLIFFPNQPIQIFNNTLNWVYNPPILNVDTIILPEDSSSLVSLDFDGRLEDSSLGVSLNVGEQIIYNPEVKRFDSECVYMGLAQILNYSTNFIFPNRFTLNFFFRLNTSPIGREILFFRKTGVISLSKPSASNSIVLTINTDVFVIPVTLLQNRDYHLYLAKEQSSNNVEVKLSTIDSNGVITTVLNQTVLLSQSTISDNANNLEFSNNVAVLDGWLQGFYLSNAILEFNAFVQPNSKYKYYWNNIPTYAWVSPYFKFEHWLKLTASKV